MLGWARHHSILAVFLPAVLPPPIPLWPFLLAAGALGVSWRRFLLAFGGGRIARYGLVGWLAAVYGRHVIHLWPATLDKWSGVILWSFAGLSIAAVLYGLWQFRRKSHAADSQRHPQPRAA